MKEATLPTSSPRSDEEIKREIDRLFGEMEQMLASTQRHLDRAAQFSEITERNLRWIEEQLHVGKTA